MTDYSPEQRRRLDELAERKAELDRRWHVAHEETKKAMRLRGEPVREDFANRRDYRAAVARFRKVRL